MGVFEDYAGDNYNREFVEDYLLQRYQGSFVLLSQYLSQFIG